MGKLKNHMLEIDPLALYSVSFFAGQVARIHPVTVYQSLAGLKKFHLPEAVKVGRSVRFSGASILAWRAALPVYGAAAVVIAQQTQKTQLGSPTKAMRIAKREAVARAAALAGFNSIKEPSNALDQDGAEQAPQPEKKRLRRPIKAAQLAKREAASRAFAVGGAA